MPTPYTTRPVIWQSVLLMSLIDCVIVAVALGLLAVLIRHREEARRLHLMPGLALTLLGVMTIAAFYGFDLITMLVLPHFIGASRAMHLMEDLHLNLSWVNTLAGIGAISIGMSMLLRRLIPRAANALAASQAAEEALRETNTRLERQIEERTRALKEDIRERERIEQRLREGKLRYRGLFDAAPIALWEEDWSGVKRLVDDWRSAGGGDLETYLDERPEALVEASAAIRVLNVNRETLKLYRALDKESFVEAINARLAQTPFMQLRERLIAFSQGAHRITCEGEDTRANGEPFLTRITVDIPREHRGTWDRVFAAMEDVTEVRRLSAQLTHQACHDAITGLVNRHEFDRRLEGLLERARAEGTEHVLCYLDLDHFKVVNDSCGHTAGDELLRQLGFLLQAQVRKQDTLARLGGDEFGVLMQECSLEQAERVTAAILHAMETFRFRWDERSFNVGVSIGVVPIVSTSSSSSEVLRAADAACYAAKERGRNRSHLYDSSDAMLDRRQADMNWVGRINHALEENRFELAFQAIVPVDRAVQEGPHHELLIRMSDDQGKLIGPGAFLPVAERYRLSTLIDQWVVRTAFQWYAGHPRELDTLHLCSINLSGQSLGDREFLKFVIHTLREFETPAEKFCFEVTETAAIADIASALHFIRELKKFGVQFSLDDFGSGLSSFGYLKSLPVDFLKIDGLFVKDIATDPVDLAMVKSINDIGHELGKRTVAEFVENDEILQRLHDLGVDYAQGYGIARPKAIGELELRRAAS